MDRTPHFAGEGHWASGRSEGLRFDGELAANVVNTRFPPDLTFSSIEDGERFQPGDVTTILGEPLDSDGKSAWASLFADGKPLGVADQALDTFQGQGASPGRQRDRAKAIDRDRMRRRVETTITALENVSRSGEVTPPSDGAEADVDVGESIAVMAEAVDAGGKVSRVEPHLGEADLFGASDRIIDAAQDEADTLLRRSLGREQRLWSRSPRASRSSWARTIFR